MKSFNYLPWGGQPIPKSNLNQLLQNWNIIDEILRPIGIESLNLQPMWS